MCRSNQGLQHRKGKLIRPVFYRFNAGGQTMLDRDEQPHDIERNGVDQAA